uniref:Uncharacterized protein n=1 Tax=viral metagenome TaxID=1070528 RepID=A0A6C0JGZ9_9ZZZZ
MSLSMRALVDRKVTNRITYMNNRLAEFALPVMRNQDLYVYRNFVVSGNEEIRGNSTIDGNLLVKGNGEIDGNLLVKGDEEVDGDLLVKGDEQVDGNINSNGYILAKTFLPGQIINMIMVRAGDVGFSYLYTGNPASVPNSTQYQKLFNYSYTPSYDTSYLIIEFFSVFTVLGNSNGANDGCYMNLSVNNQEIGYSQVIFLNGNANQGSGVIRGSTALPISSRYTNTNDVTKTISFAILSSDIVNVNYDTSTWLKITEVGR